MALILGQTLVGTAATFITAVPAGPYALTLATGGTAVSVGTVNNGTLTTFSTGAVINANSSIQFAGFPGSAGTSLYGTTVTGTAAVSYFLSTGH
jgi:hypothetical protein